MSNSLFIKVRKMVGVLVAAAEGDLTEKDVYEMLTIPSYANWPFNIAYTLPGHALFLTGIEYEEPEVGEDSATIDESDDSKDKNVNAIHV